MNVKKFPWRIKEKPAITGKVIFPAPEDLMLAWPPQIVSAGGFLVSPSAPLAADLPPQCDTSFKVKDSPSERPALCGRSGVVEAALRGRSAVQPEMAERLELQGWERALTYELLLTTGMRKSELASLTIEDVDLCNDAPAVTLRGIHAKNGKRATIPLRPDVAIHVRDWLADRRRCLAAQGKVLAADDRLVQIPSRLIRILDRDLAAAGIPRVDERGRQLDVHAMHTTFNSYRAKGLGPSTSSLGRSVPVVLSPANKRVAACRGKRCTGRCTSTRQEGAASAGDGKPPVSDAAARTAGKQHPAIENLAARLASLPPEAIAALQAFFGGPPERPKNSG